MTDGRRSAKLEESFVAEWRNWQTHQTQNLAFFTGREGSTPSSATNNFSITESTSRQLLPLLGLTRLCGARGDRSVMIAGTSRKPQGPHTPVRCSPENLYLFFDFSDSKMKNVCPNILRGAGRKSKKLRFE